MKLIVREASVQAALAVPSHDQWVSPDCKVTAAFHRLSTGFLVRFPDQADFTIDLARGIALCTPARDGLLDEVQSLFHNAIEPLVGNYAGGLFLHGSAVSLGGTAAVAFLGESRRGKTTLAGAFARAGHPFLTEDTVELHSHDGRYLLQPSRPVLRLFADSADHLLDGARHGANDQSKTALDSSGSLPFADVAVPLHAVFFLGDGSSEEIAITPMTMPEALAELMRHGFILDVEDKARLRGHFQRLGELATTIGCYTLDFPRQYSLLPAVIDAIGQHVTSKKASKDLGNAD